MIGAFLCAASLPARAQQGTSEIGGKVTDAQGAVLPGVAIVVTNEDTGLFARSSDRARRQSTSSRR